MLGLALDEQKANVRTWPSSLMLGSIRHTPNFEVSGRELVVERGPPL